MEMKKFLCFLAFWVVVEVEGYSLGRMPKGFRVSPASEGNFQPLLLSQNSRFAFGFKRLDQSNFLLSVVCVADLSAGVENATEIVWSANRNNAVKTGAQFVQDLDGSLALLDDQGRPRWEVHVARDAHVDAELALLDSGNLQLQQMDGDVEEALWQSFDHPTDTLLQGQNFTAKMRLIAAVSPSNVSEGEYTLQMEAAGMSLTWKSEQVYWRRLAMQERAVIVPGKGQIYARLELDGYIAMYQTESHLLDVFPLDTYHQNVTLRRLKIESDGNLRSYYWSKRSSRWETDLVAVQSNCQLPSFCGPHALCTVDSRCICLLSPTNSKNQGFLPGRESADFCQRREYSVARIPGIDLPFSRYSDFTAVESEGDCRDLCVGNCSCAAAVYYKNSKRCYEVRGPLQTLAQVATIHKVAFVKYVNQTIVANNGGGGCERLRCKGLRLMGWVAVVVVGASAFVAWRCMMCYKRGVADTDISIEMDQKFMRRMGYKRLTMESSMR